MKITTLIENVAYAPRLVAEHGLSMLIDTGTHKVLFDTGQSDKFLQNAKLLGVDISKVDHLVLSHGHYDHAGGLYPFLENNANANIICKKELFEPHYSGHTRYIGTPFKPEALANRLHFTDTVTELVPNVFIVPFIHIYHTIDTHFKGLYIKTNGHFEEDTFNDELFLVIRDKEALHIVTACSHRGISNICQTATEHFQLPVKTITGGFHLKECSTEQYMELTWYLRQLNLQSVGVCHCTGIDKYSDMRNDCDTHVFYNFTGKTLNLQAQPSDYMTNKQ